MEWRPAGWSVCLPLLIFRCTIKSRSSLLALAHPGGPGRRAIKRLWCGVAVAELSTVFLMLHVARVCVRSGPFPCFPLAWPSMGVFFYFAANRVGSFQFRPTLSDAFIDFVSIPYFRQLVTRDTCPLPTLYQVFCW